MGNKELDVVQVKLVMDKTLYSEEQLSSPDQVVQFMRKELSEYDREVFCILNCTTKSQVINMNIVSMGTINESLVTGREVFKSAILSNASYVILLHNHPSGDPQPSHHDFLVTAKLCAGGNILGIDVLDHIIVGGRTGTYHSMAKEGELENLRTKLLEPAKAVAEPLFQRPGKRKSTESGGYENSTVPKFGTSGKDLKIFSIGESKRKDGMMEKESNFRETWKMRIWMFLKMVNWICKKYCGFVAATGCVFGTIVLYVLATEASVQISIAQKDYEMLLPGTFTIGAAIYILFMTGYREICCRNKFSVEVPFLESFYLLLIVVLFMKFHLWKDLYTIAGYAVLFLFVFSGVETVLQTQKTKGENAKPDDYKEN